MEAITWLFLQFTSLFINLSNLIFTSGSVITSCHDILLSRLINFNIWCLSNFLLLVTGLILFGSLHITGSIWAKWSDSPS
jgi:hypothetical protein